VKKLDCESFIIEDSEPKNGRESQLTMSELLSNIEKNIILDPKFGKVDFISTLVEKMDNIKNKINKKSEIKKESKNIYPNTDLINVLYPDMENRLQNYFNLAISNIKKDLIVKINTLIETELSNEKVIEAIKLASIPQKENEMDYTKGGKPETVVV
jgi:hypothetical protein